jgi:hypothetical protein
MTSFTRTIISEIGVSAVIAAGSAVVLPKLADPTAPINYTTAFGVFLACSLAFAGYEFLTRRA